MGTAAEAARAQSPVLGAHGSRECAGFKVHEKGRLCELPLAGGSAVRQAPATDQLRDSGQTASMR